MGNSACSFPMTFDTWVTFEACLLHSVRKCFVAHMCWVFHGLAWSWWKQGRTLWVCSVNVDYCDEVLKAGGENKQLLLPVLGL